MMSENKENNEPKVIAGSGSRKMSEGLKKLFAELTAIHQSPSSGLRIVKEGPGYMIIAPPGS